jgi:hypothetical protein
MKVDHPTLVLNGGPPQDGADLDDDDDDDDMIDPDNEDIVIPMYSRGQMDVKPVVGDAMQTVVADRAGPFTPTVKRETEPLNQGPSKRHKGSEGQAVAGIAMTDAKPAVGKPALSAASAGAVSAAELRAYLVSTSGKVTIKDLLGHFKKRLKSPEDQTAFRMVMQQIAKIQEVKQPDGSSKKVVVLKS